MNIGRVNYCCVLSYFTLRRLTAEALPDTIDFNEDLNFPAEEEEESEYKDDDSLRSFSSHSNSPQSQSMQFVEEEPVVSRRRSSLVTPQQSPIDQQSTVDFSPINTTLPSSPTAAEEETSFRKYMLLKKTDFLQHMKLLQRRQRWIETLSKRYYTLFYLFSLYIPRSSLDFIRHHQFDSRSMMDRFILLLAKGATVRRHQVGDS